MYVNRFQINISTLASGTTASTVNIPLNMDFQLVDTAELIDRVFVEQETENAINPILDYDRVRYMPIDPNNNNLKKIIYDLSLFDSTNNYTTFYDGIGFNYDDIKFRKNAFTHSFLNLSLYDSSDPLIQNLVGYMTLYCHLNKVDLLSGGTGNISIGLPKPVSQIPIKFVLENPIINKRGFGEGFHLYYYKDSLKIGESKYLYMKASFMNAKTGKSKNLMVKNTPQNIQNLVHELYVRIKISRTTTGYYYQLDDTYQGNNPNNTNANNNVTYTGNNEALVRFYEVKAL
jgi:hypothetical protein